MNDYLVKAYAFSGTVRIYAARSTHLVERARQIHDTWPAATAAFGRVLTAGVIMGAMYKGDQTLSIQIDGGGPIGRIIVTTDANGHVRGTLHNPHVHMSTNDGKLAVGQVVGHHGFIHVTKDVKIRDTFTSSAALQTGEIGDDFAFYFAMSEQIPSSVGVGVLVNDTSEVLASGGFILQVMPGSNPETIASIEQRIQAMRPVSTLILEGMTPEEIITEITQGDHKIIEEMPINYNCDCSRERFSKGLISLGVEELDDMISAGEPIETTCHFCGKQYHFPVDELTALKQKTQNNRVKTSESIPIS